MVRAFVFFYRNVMIFIFNTVLVTLQGPIDPVTGMVANVADLKLALQVST